MYLGNQTLTILIYVELSFQKILNNEIFMIEISNLMETQVTGT